MEASDVDFNKSRHVSDGTITVGKESSEDQELAQKAVQEFNYLYGLRGNWNSHWTEIAMRMYPDHSYLFQQFAPLSQMGDKRMTQVYDSTAILALQRFGAILDSLLTPRNQYWHQLEPDDETLRRDKATRIWFEQVNRILFRKRYEQTANFSSNNQEQYLSLGAYGTGGMFIDDLYGQSGLRYKNIHLSQLYLEQNHQNVVDKVIRYFVMTARQAYQMFGEACPEAISKTWQDFPEQQFFFIHKVAPNGEMDPDRKDFRGMKYTSQYVSVQGQKLVAKGGYRTFPYAISRYRQSPYEAYGRSIGMDVLPAVKTLNEEKKVMLKAGHRALDPILLAHDDGVADAFAFEAGSVNVGGVTKDGRLLIHPLPVGNIPDGEKLMEDERKLINDSFLVNLFQILIETPEMSATEVMERAREKGILLAPTIGRQESEYLGPMIDRELDILSRQDALPPQPALLKSAKGQYRIVYNTPITRSQKADQVSGGIRAIQIFSQFYQATQNPDALNIINITKAAPDIAEAFGVPATWVNTQDDILRLKQVQEQQRQAQLAIQAAPAAAGVMKAQAAAKG